VVVQGTTLIVWIVGTVLVLSAIVAEVMVVHMINPTALAQVGSSILLSFYRMLDVRADQGCYGGDLG